MLLDEMTKKIEQKMGENSKYFWIYYGGSENFTFPFEGNLEKLISDVPEIKYVEFSWGEKIPNQIYVKSSYSREKFKTFYEGMWEFKGEVVKGLLVKSSLNLNYYFYFWNTPKWGTL